MKYLTPEEITQRWTDLIRIADDLLALPRVDGVRVTIRKVRPPVPQDVATSGVTIVRRRPPR